MASNLDNILSNLPDKEGGITSVLDNLPDKTEATPSDITPVLESLPDKPFNYLDFARDSSIDETRAKDYEDGLLNNMAFGINTEDAMRDKSAIDLAISHNQNAGIQKAETRKKYDGVSSIGAHWQYQPKGVETTVKRLTRGEIIDFARKFKEQGLIKEEDLREVLLNPDPGDVFGRTVGPFTEENLPKPDDFYSKGWGERFSEILPSGAGGVNYAIAGFFRGVQWLEGEAGVSLGSKGVADWLEENAAFATRGVRQDFGTEIYGAAGSMMTLVAPGAVVGRTGKLLGLSERLALSLEIGAVTVGEALMEAGPSFNNVLQETGDINKAKRAGRISFFSNVAVTSVANGLGIYKSRIQALEKATGRTITKEGSKASRAIGKVAGKAKEGLPEFAEEFLQEGVIAPVAEDKPIDVEAGLRAGVIGFGLGAGTASLMSQAVEKIDEVGPMPPEVEGVYDTTVQEGLDAGLDIEQANIEASREIAKTEEGQEYINKIGIAQEAVLKAEAAMGRDVPVEEITEAVEPAPLELADVAEQLEAGTLTEEQAIDEIERRLTEIPEDVEIKITPENVQEVSAQSSIDPRVPAFENEQEILKDDTLAPELTNIEPLKTETFNQGQREYRTTPEVATEAIAEAFNDNPGQPRGVVYRGMSIDQIENGRILLEGVRDHKFNNDPSQSVKAVWTSSSYETAVERASEHGDKGIIIAIPTSSLPENVYLQNASLTPGSIEDVWLGIPGDIKMNNVQIQPLTDALEGRKMELRRTEDDTIIGEPSRRERRDIRGIEGAVPRPGEVEGVAGVPSIEAGRPRRPRETGRVSPEDAARGREGLLGEEGAIDLDSEVSLAPILTKLKTFTDNPAQALADLTSLGRSIFAEGKTEFKDFVLRMQEIMGDTWKTFIAQIEQAWSILNNERGSIGRQKQIDSPEFKAWFKDSKVVDERGNPLIVYHGTPDARGILEEGFKTPKEKLLKLEDTERAFFFSDKITASTYADDARAFDFQNAEPAIIDVFLSFQNPKIIDWGGKVWKGTHKAIQEAQEAGHDSIIINNVIDTYQGKGKVSTVYAAFDPTQIKSATKNVGTFDPTELGIGGFIDLDAEISLAPILEKLQAFRDNPSQGLADITNLGRSIFDEGKTSLQAFNTRMQEILGDLWESFKNIARQAWEVVNNERGEIEIGLGGQPEFDLNFNFSHLLTQVKFGKTNPAFMEDNPSWSEDEVIRALDRAQKGLTITEREAEIVYAALAEAGANFYQEVMTSEDDFINPKEFLEEGELDAIIEAGVNEFVGNLKVVTPTTLSPEQKAKKERTKTIRQQGKQIKALQETLEEKAELLHQAVLDAERRAQLTKQGTKIAQEEIKRLDSKIETRDKKVAELREKTNSAAKTARAFIKGRTGAELARIKATEVKGTPTQREAIKVALQAARTAFREGKTEGVAAEGARLREQFELARGEREETVRRNKLRKKIKSVLRATKVKKVAGKPVGKFTPDIQNVLDKMRAAANLNPIEARLRINENLANAKDEIPSDDIVLENRILSMVHNFGEFSRLFSHDLEKLLTQIRALIDQGKMINELKKFNRQAQTEKAVIEAVDVISGGKGLPAGADAKTRKTNYERVTGLTDRAKRWFSTTGKTIVGWKDILDILSRLDPSKPFASRLSEIGNVLPTKNIEKQGIYDTTKEIQDMYRESYGIPLKGRAADRQAIKQIQEDSRPIDLGTFTDLNGESVPIEITRAEARKRYLEFQDPTLASTFVEGMAYTEEMRAAITDVLTPEDKAFAQAQLDFYNRYYEGINETYREVYGVDLPRNEFYTPIRREGYLDTNSGFGEFLQNINFSASTAPGGVKTRTQNILPIKFTSDLSILEQHMTEMEHFKAWANRVRELRSVFNNTEVKAAVEVYHGDDMTGVIDNFINDFARGGVDRGKNVGWLDKWRANIARSVLAVKPAIGLKQLTSFVAYSDAMPVTEFVKGTVEFWKNPVKNAKFIYENSTLLANRGQNIERDLKDAQRTDAYKTWRKGQSFMNALMLNIHIGDQGAIVMGGWPLINYHMKQGKSVEEAIEIFEQVTESTQQSADLSDLSVWQRGGSFAKLFTLYRSSPNQYVRKEIAALRNLFAGRQGVKQTAKTVAIFHLLLPMLFQFVSDGFTWDEDEQERALIFGPLNGIFIVGDILEGIVRKALGLREFDDEIPMLSLKDDAIKALNLVTDDDLSDEDVLRGIRGIASGVGTLTGAPLKTVVDVGAGVDEILTGDFERGAAQVLGYSPSVAKKISGR